MGTLTLTDPVNGTSNDATTIASNNSAVKAVINGGIDNTNVSGSAALAVSKLAPGSNGQVLTTTGGVPVWGTASGSAAKGTWSVTLTAQNANTQAVTHGFGSTPTAVIITPTVEPTLSGVVMDIWVDTIGATTFTVHARFSNAGTGSGTITGAWIAV